MSTRYVWGQYSIANKETLENIAYINAPESSFPFVVASGYTYKSPATVSPSGNISSLPKDGSVSAVTFPYIFSSKAPNPNEYGTLHGNKNAESGDIWVSERASTGPYPFNLRLKNGGTNKRYDNIKVTIEPGNLEGYASKSSRNYYPDDSTSGSYWYKYLGSDNIDATAVRYSKNDELYPGDSVTITVTPRTPTYGGTVYYRYQYSINGGSTWRDIGNRTTATSATVTIPEGAERFRARVLASDGWGFTSTTYVYGPAKEVSQLKAYVGVNAKAGSLKKGYVGVTAKARSLVKGYVGVGGVAKKLF